MKKPETAMELSLLCAEERYNVAKRDREKVFTNFMECINKAYEDKNYGWILSDIFNHLDEMVCCCEQVEEREAALNMIKAAMGNLKAIEAVEENLYNLDIEYEEENNDAE